MARSRVFAAALLLVSAATLAGCSSGPTAAVSSSHAPQTVTVTLLTHDSFAVDKRLLTTFEKQSGITVDIQSVGDAGQLVSSAVLAAGAPSGDVLFGVDNSLAPKAVAAQVFSPYASPNLHNLVAPLQANTFGGVLTPVDYGDVCVVVDKTWFAAHHAVPPSTLSDLTKPAFANLLVVEDPALSSPGTAFLYATIARYGSAWKQYWTRLRNNGVQVANSWTQAYSGDFTAGGGKGSRPLVVSYGTDAAADIVYASNPKPSTPRVAVMHDGCYRQIEYAGVLRGTAHPAAAGKVVDWLTSQSFQAGVPMAMFVYPARSGVALPSVFTKWAPQATHPLQLPPATVAANETSWLSDWGSVMGRA